MLELFNERAAIREYDGQKTREEAERLAREDVEAHRHRCEVDLLVRMYEEKGADAVKSYLLQCEARRGTAATERLRNDSKEKIREKQNEKQASIRSGR